MGLGLGFGLRARVRGGTRLRLRVYCSRPGMAMPGRAMGGAVTSSRRDGISGKASSTIELVCGSEDRDESEPATGGITPTIMAGGISRSIAASRS